jgi:hypothetical protein
MAAGDRELSDMSQSESDPRPGVHVDRLMLHDLVNHLTIALGHSELLLMEVESDHASRPVLAEIRNACRAAVDVVEGWRAHLPLEE